MSETPEKMSETAFMELAVRYLDNQLNADEMQWFCAHLEASAAARELFVRFATLHGLLAEQAGKGFASPAATHGGLELDALPPARGAGAKPGDRAPHAPAEMVGAAVSGTGEPRSSSGPSWRAGRAQTAQRRIWRMAAMLLLLGLLVVLVVSPWRGPQPLGTLVAATEAQWDSRHVNLRPGDVVTTGPLGLQRGMARILLHNGVALILQAPTELNLQSVMAATMTAGRMTTRVSKEGIGFTLHTPLGDVVDLGTEFGVDLPPGGDGVVHVFQGKVNLLRDAKGQAAAPPTELTERMSARVDGPTGAVQLVQDSSDGFVRSLDQTQQNRHVVAYWRFEDHPVGDLVPHTKGNQVPTRGAIDSSPNGNDLFTLEARTQPRFSRDVPESRVRQSGQSNTGSLDNTTVPEGDAGARDVYTRSQFSHAAPLDIQKITPAQWTIEASVKVQKLRTDYCTFLARDGEWADAQDPRRAPLYFQITGWNDDHPQRFAIKYGDVNRRFHEATAANLAIQLNHWYHLAAVSDGKTLSLYIDQLDGRGYVLQARTELPPTGSTAMGKTRDDYPWVVGRAFFHGHAVDWFQGWIDEVRICDAALAPEQFLFAVPAATTLVPKGKEKTAGVTNDKQKQGWGEHL